MISTLTLYEVFMLASIKRRYGNTRNIQVSEIVAKYKTLDTKTLS